jgi:hypothetical protein
MQLTKERLQPELETLRLTHEGTRELFDREAGAIQILEQLIALLDQPEPEDESKEGEP